MKENERFGRIYPSVFNVAMDAPKHAIINGQYSRDDIFGNPSCELADAGSTILLDQPFRVRVKALMNVGGSSGRGHR